MGNSCCGTNSSDENANVGNNLDTPIQNRNVIHGYEITEFQWKDGYFDLHKVVKKGTKSPALVLQLKIPIENRGNFEAINVNELSNHENIVEYHDLKFSNDYQHFYAIMNLHLCDKNFREFLRMERRSKKDIYGYVFQISSALEHLHKLKITHGDLNPSNILVKGLNAIPTMLKVTAFGFNSGTIRDGSYYYAPEQKNHQSFETSVDIWALGVMFYEMANYNVIDIDMRKIEHEKNIKFRNSEFKENDSKLLKLMVKNEAKYRKPAAELKDIVHRQIYPQ